MNVVRLIKLKQLNGEFDLLNQAEKRFISMFNDNIYFDIEGHQYFFNQKSEHMFDYDSNRKLLWCNYTRVLGVFENEYDMNYEIMADFVKNIIVRHLSFDKETAVLFSADKIELRDEIRKKLQELVA